MADYENRPVPEGINVTPTPPLKEFALLLAGISTTIVVAVLALSLLAGYLVRFVPFSQEKALMSGVDVGWLKAATAAGEAEKQRYLQGLADRLAAVMELPQDMSITVHYSPDRTVNAMATLGGNVVVFQGLIATLPSENALAMVLAHEIAHIRHRHPIVAIGRGFTVMLALSSLAGVGDGLMQQWLGNIGMLPVLTFNRAQEAEADAAALQAVQRTYGHVGDAAAFFEYVAQHRHGLETPAIFNTHPGHQERIRQIRDFEAGHPPPSGFAIQPLPDFLKTAPAQPTR